ncbi:hypothetical protein E8E14_000643 [Neopestalotiopsis sp. 37M]|nr:hypothetical protein E8E14_000643 [Neopestalotiopsis sp. 37M]
MSDDFDNLMPSLSFKKHLSNIRETYAHRSSFLGCNPYAAPTTTLSTVQTSAAAPETSSTSTYIAVTTTTAGPTITSAAASTTTSAASTGSSSSSGVKRGFGYSDASLVSAIVSAASTSSGWCYDWDFTNGGLTADVNYIPMLWGPSYYDSSWSEAASSAVSNGDAFDGHKRIVLPALPEKPIESPNLPRLDARYIIPFAKDREDDPSPILGGFSKVFKVRIHPSHSRDRASNDDSPGAFALKAIHSSKRSAYEFSKEIQALMKFSGSYTGHPHIIKLLAAFSHEDQHYLVFPWADGNLRTFWRENPTPLVNFKFIVWLAGQLAGLTGALRAIHQYPLENGLSLFGRHGDIKPSNILVFRNQQDGVRFHIADFGLARFHSSEARLNLDQPKAVTPTYRPPEFDLRSPMGQKADIWSLGCVFLEMMVWVLEGYHGLKSFIYSRMATTKDSAAERKKHDAFFVLNQFDNQKGLIPSIKPSVQRCIEQLHQAAKCSPFSHDLLNLIEHEMLCVDEQARPTSFVILERLQEMQQKCRKEAEYTAPRPLPLKPPWILRHPKHTYAPITSQIKDTSQVDKDIDLKHIPIRVNTTHISTHCRSEHPNSTSKLSSQYFSKLLKTSSESAFEQFRPKEQHFKMPPNMLDSVYVEAASRQYATEPYQGEAPENRKRKLNVDIPEIGEEYPQKRVHTEADQQSPHINTHRFLTHVNSELETHQSLSAFREHLVTLSREGNSEEQNEAQICMKNLQKFEDLMTESESLSHSTTNLTTFPTLTNDSTVSDFASQDVQHHNPLEGRPGEVQTESESFDTIMEQNSVPDFDWNEYLLIESLKESFDDAPGGHQK